VPAVFFWSGTIEPKIISEGIFSLMDIFPTAAALAGGKEPDSYGLNGVNILPVLQGESLNYRPRQSYFYYSLTSLQAVRMDNWKLVLPREKNSPYLLWLGKYMDRVEKPMLFNLKLDASEQNDLANERPDLVAKMLLEVEKAREEFGDYNRIGTASRFFDLGPKRPKTYFPTHGQP
jgi:arylsulfatase A-like enzyme